ncbi:MAG: hypothetical protein RL736_739, partial [Pseudomonadota bacterium]
MNNNNETAPKDNQEEKVNNIETAETNAENNIEKQIEELNDKLLRSLAENQ